MDDYFLRFTPDSFYLVLAVLLFSYAEKKIIFLESKHIKEKNDTQEALECISSSVEVLIGHLYKNEPLFKKFIPSFAKYCEIHGWGFDPKELISDIIAKRHIGGYERSIH